MEVKIKDYSGKDVRVLLNWTGKFLDLILDEYSIYGNFTPEGIHQHFEKETDLYDKFFVLNENTIALKIYRLFLRGFFQRVLEVNNRNIRGRKTYFRYSFSDKSKELINNYGSFNVAFNNLKGGI